MLAECRPTALLAAWSADDRADKRLHTLHLERCFTPCSHGPLCFGAIFRFVPFLVNSSLDVSVFSASPTFGTSILTLGLQTVVIIPRDARSARPSK